MSLLPLLLHPNLSPKVALDYNVGLFFANLSNEKQYSRYVGHKNH